MNEINELEIQGSTGERLEKTRRITAEDLKHLYHELEPLGLIPPDRNYVVSLRKRDIEDKKTPNSKRKEQYIKDGLDIDPSNVTLPDGNALHKDLVVDSLFSWISSSYALQTQPERQEEIVNSLNLKILLQDEKRKLVESGAIKAFAKNGLGFFPSERSLPKGALKTMWNALEKAIEDKQPPSPIHETD